MGKVAVSVIVPVYNTAEYLNQCLDKFLRQNTRDTFEVILVDDGSTDASGRICDSYAKRHPDLFRVVHTENRGLSAARNAGLKEARGEWIAFADSDDVPYVHFISALLRLARKDPECDVACLSYRYVNKRRRSHATIFPAKKGNVNNIQAFSALLRDIGVRAYVWDKLFRKELLDRCGIKFLDVRGGFEDLPFVSGAFLSARKVLFDRIPVIGYRNHREGSLTRGGLAQDRLRDHICAFFAARTYADIKLGKEEASKIFTRSKPSIGFTLLADLPLWALVPFKRWIEGINQIRGAQRRLLETAISYKDLPWEKHVESVISSYREVARG